MLVAGGGVVIGGASTVLLGRGLRSVLFATEPFDPLVFSGATAVMLMIATLATLLPAREAAKADPSVLLRAE
jgi:ABC-type lipoprotein release transport system permease subunit